MQDHPGDGGEENQIPKHSQRPANDRLPADGAGLQAVIEEILSEEDHQAAQRKLGAAQLRIARQLNRITAIGAIVGVISSLGIIASLVITRIAADDAHKALVAANRAWIGPVSLTLAAIPSAPPTEDITVLLPFRNTGHEPATDAFIVAGSDSISIAATYDEIHLKEQSFEDYCFSVPGANHMAAAVTAVIFPGDSSTSYFNRYIRIRSDLIDWDAVYGRKYVYVHACVVYQTFGEVRHTSVCYYAQAGKSVGDLPFCDKGNRAD